MTHENEIKYWSEHPDGTKVWCKSESTDGWVLIEPKWTGIGTYIVDNEWAELRKAQADGKQLQYDNSNGWCDSKLSKWDYINKNTEVKYWRIKPEEPVYEWQWIWIDKNGKYHFTDFYSKVRKAIKETPIDCIQDLYKYEPSRRVNK